MRTIIILLIGAGAMYLYLNPGDTDGLIDTGKTAINKAANAVADITDTSPAEKLQKEVDSFLK